MNMYSDEGFDGETYAGEASINTYLADTISHVFNNVTVVDVPNATNKELFATDADDFMVRLGINANMEENPDLTAMMQKVMSTGQSYVGKGHIMTDDKAPVELLGMKQIDLIIKDEVSYYRKIYEQKGIQGLIDLL